MKKLDFIASRTTTKDFVFIITYIDNFCPAEYLDGIVNSPEEISEDETLSNVLTRLCSFALGSDDSLKRWCNIYQHALINEGLLFIDANKQAKQIYNVLTD